MIRNVRDVYPDVWRLVIESALAEARVHDLVIPKSSPLLAKVSPGFRHERPLLPFDMEIAGMRAVVAMAVRLLYGAAPEHELAVYINPNPECRWWPVGYFAPVSAGRSGGFAFAKGEFAEQEPLPDEGWFEANPEILMSLDQPVIGRKLSHPRITP